MGCARNFETGMMDEYLSDLKARQQRYPIVEFVSSRP
jgi:hypothetical protein